MFESVVFFPIIRRSGNHNTRTSKLFHNSRYLYFIYNLIYYKLYIPNVLVNNPVAFASVYVGFKSWFEIHEIIIRNCWRNFGH